MYKKHHSIMKIHNLKTAVQPTPRSFAYISCTVDIVWFKCGAMNCYCHIPSENQCVIMQACGCGASGSVRLQCDPNTGHCACQEGFQGDRCSSCSPGYYGFPHCQRCDCHLVGSDEAQCDAAKGYCQCDDSGQCPCKVN